MIVPDKWHVERIETRAADYSHTVQAIAQLRSDDGRAMRLEVVRIIANECNDSVINGTNAETRALASLCQWIRAGGYIPDFHILREARADRLFLTTTFGNIATITEQMQPIGDEDEALMCYAVTRRDANREDTIS